jgi:hypothetical protein
MMSMDKKMRISGAGVSAKTVGNGNGTGGSYAPRAARTEGMSLEPLEAAVEQSLVDQAGGIIAITYDEAHTAPNSAFKNLSAAQKRTAHEAMERLEEWAESSSPMTRAYEVTQWPGKPTVVYGRLRNARAPREETQTRFELDAAGNIIAQHVAYFDELGPVWYRRKAHMTEEQRRWTKAR